MQMRVENEKETAAVAASLVPYLRKGDVVTLSGDLGAGKTAFARALINACAVRNGARIEDVPSPTFTIVQTYDFNDISIHHYDLYRLDGDIDDIIETGWDETRRHAVALVEWPDRLGGLLPPDRLEINIGFIEDSENARLVDILPVGRFKNMIEPADPKGSTP